MENSEPQMQPPYPQQEPPRTAAPGLPPRHNNSKQSLPQTPPMMDAQQFMAARNNRTAYGGERHQHYRS